ncbi:MAG: THxN family PEP-CTERM protein [Chlamydiales bacterium]|nr:THxN family PEP-CTERM protein [Chlamydiales bacterium]
MNKFTRGVLAFTMAAAFSVSSLSFAAITINSVSGNWMDVVGGNAVVYPVPNEVRWGETGESTNDKSGYRFDGDAPPLFNVLIDTPFTLGTFKHFNKPIPSGSAIQSAQLDTTINMNINGTAINGLNFAYDFLHTETPNMPGSCPAGSGSVCDDIVKALNNVAQSSTFLIGGDLYTIKVIGFEVNGQPFTDFLTLEDQTNSAKLKAIVTKYTPVPEPGTYLILGSALGMCFFLKRPKRVEV